MQASHTNMMMDGQTEMMPNEKSTKVTRGGVLFTFPIRLHELLQAAEKCQALACVISWNEDGTSFWVHDKKAFERERYGLHISTAESLVISSPSRNTRKRRLLLPTPSFKIDEPYLCNLKVKEKTFLRIILVLIH